MPRNSDNSPGDFLLTEYENLAKAHFETIKQVSIFFRYYIIIIAAPLFIFYLLGDKYSVEQLFSGVGIPSVYINLVAYLFLVLSIIGLFVCLYIISPKHASVYYARSVNGIRYYFYQIIDISEMEEKVRILPKDIGVPNYFELFFLPVVMTFGVINASFLYLFITIKCDYYSVLLSTAWGLLHILLYYSMSVYRQKKYLKG